MKKVRCPICKTVTDYWEDHKFIKERGQCVDCTIDGLGTRRQDREDEYYDCDRAEQNSLAERGSER